MKHVWFDWGLGAAAAVLLGTGLTAAGVTARSGEAAHADAPMDPRLLAASFLSADSIEAAVRDVRRVEVQRNDTLSDVLDRLGVSREESNGAVYAASQFVNLRYVRPGDSVTAWIETDTSGETHMTGMSLRPEAERQVMISRALDGTWGAHELKARMTPGYSLVSAPIETSISDAARANGATEQQVVDYADIFGYDIDFQREIHPGDKFEILYETFRDERGAPVKNGSVLYASMDGDALTKAFYRFTPSDDGVTDYFTADGQSAKKFLMKTPINGARLSSGFGNRKHPILGYTKLHKGTDFAAPTGTPIYAAGNGVIEKAGPWSTFGNYVRIQHANGYETAYAHMSRFAAGTKRGARVRQGDVIGYVGTTGASTGPHLHYEVYIDNKPVNAMGLKLPTGRKLTGAQLAAFQAEAARIDQIRAEQAAPPEALMADAQPGLAAGALVPVAATSTQETRGPVPN